MLAVLQSRLYGLLRWSERYTKLDMVYLASGSFWVTFGQGISSIFSLLLVVAFANLLPPDTYGIYRYILSLAGLLNIFSLTGMNSAVARAVAVGQDGALRSSVRYQLKWNLIMLAAFFALSGYYLLKGDELFAAAFFIFGVFTPATLAFNTYGAYLEGKKYFMLASIATILSTLIYTAGMLTALFFGAEVILLVVVYTGTTFASTLFFYSYTLRKFRPPAASPGEELRFGRQLTLIGLLDPIAAQIDKIILVQFWGPAQLAVYSLAMAVPGRAIVSIKTLVGLGAPKFAQKTPQEINEMFYRRVFQGVLFGALAAAVYILLAPLLFRYILPQYLEATIYSQILALSFVFAMPNRLVSLLLVSQKLTRVIFVNNLSQSIMRIVLYVVFGIYGGILGLVCAFVVMSFISMLINITIWRWQPWLLQSPR